MLYVETFLTIAYDNWIQNRYTAIKIPLRFSEYFFKYPDINIPYHLKMAHKDYDECIKNLHFYWILFEQMFLVVDF
jgi:hypothetical protein